MKIKHLTILGLAMAIAAPCANADGRTFGDGLPEFLQHYDVNEDGKIDEEERQAVKAAREARHDEWIAKWDENDDGTLSDEEKEAAKEAIRARIVSRRTDHFNAIAGDDGLLSLEEFSAIPVFADVDPKRVAALFGHLDSDDSGDVTLEEFTARLRHHRPGHHGPKRPGQEGDR